MASVPDLVSLAVNAPDTPSPLTPACPGLPGLHLPHRPVNPTRSSPRPSHHSRLCPQHATQWGLWHHDPEGRVWTCGAEGGVCEGPLPVDVAGTALQAPLRFGEHVLGWPYSCTWVGGWSQSTLAQAQAGGSSRRRGQARAGRRVRLALSRLFRPSSWAQCCDSSSHVWTCLGHEVPRCVVKPQPCVVCACVCMHQCACVCVCAGRSSANPLNGTVHGWRKGVELSAWPSEPGQGSPAAAGLGPQP